jgi:hypothetical protein
LRSEERVSVGVVVIVLPSVGRPSRFIQAA